MRKQPDSTSTFRKAIALLTPRERRRGFIVLALVAVMALFELIGVASILPFLGVLADPDIVKANGALSWLYDVLQFGSTHQFLLFLGTAAFCLLLVSALVRSGGHYAMARFMQLRRHSIGSRLLETYLRQPYEYYLNRHTGNMAKGILSEVDQVILGVFQPFGLIVAHGLTLAAMITLIVLVDTKIALLAGAVLGSAYGVIYAAIRRYLSSAGARRVVANRERFQATNEALGGIKDIKLLGREHAYLQRFLGPSLEFSSLMAVTQVLAQLPKFIVEVIAFGGIILLSLYLMVRNVGHDANALGQVLPILGLYAFAGYRMLPAIQAIYQASTQLRFGKPALDALYDDLCGAENLPALQHRKIPKIPFSRQLTLEAIRYTYPNSSGRGVQGVDIVVPAGSTVGIVGSTGAGKTTLVDIVLGLLTPTEGRIEVDGMPITPENLRNWQANIGYVPQDIFLVDASIAANIAMGIPEDQVDNARIRDCARLAQLDRVIEEELPEGYMTKVGEHGVRFSGGQRQRLGIARALYHDPELIVFDEATSALDNLTERELMKAVGALHGSKTIIMIAHRLSTVKLCDNIVVFEKGQMVGQGNWDSLIAESTAFRRIAQVSDAA